VRRSKLASIARGAPLRLEPDAVVCFLALGFLGTGGALFAAVDA
jgi:hypothetical protein